MEMINKPDIVQTIEQAGFELKRKGKSFWLSCPFHEEKTPSLKIDPERQSFFCFGCNAKGDSITFIQKVYRLSFKEACQYLNINKPLRISPETQKKRGLVKVFREWERSLKKELTDYYRDFKTITKDLTTMEEVEGFVGDFNLILIVEWYLEILTYGSDEEKYNLFKRIR